MGFAATSWLCGVSSRTLTVPGTSGDPPTPGARISPQMPLRVAFFTRPARRTRNPGTNLASSASVAGSTAAAADACGGPGAEAAWPELVKFVCDALDGSAAAAGAAVDDRACLLPPVSSLRSCLDLFGLLPVHLLGDPLRDRAFFGRLGGRLLLRPLRALKLRRRLLLRRGLRLLLLQRLRIRRWLALRLRPVLRRLRLRRLRLLLLLLRLRLRRKALRLRRRPLRLLGLLLRLLLPQLLRTFQRLQTSRLLWRLRFRLRLRLRRGLAFGFWLLLRFRLRLLLGLLLPLTLRL